MKTNTYNNNNVIRKERFEFIFYINNHIICQRYFTINNFNEDSVNSTIELKEMMDNLIGMNSLNGKLGIIPDFLKQKSKEFLWKRYNPYFEPNLNETTTNVITEEPIKNIYHRTINYQLDIRIDEKSLVKGEFNGNLFHPPSEKNQINIKEIAPVIIKEIRDTLSQKNYTIDDELVAIKDEIYAISPR